MSVSETRTFRYAVLVGDSVPTMAGVGQLVINETRSADKVEDLESVMPEFGFHFLDPEGKMLASVEAGYFPFFAQLVRQAAPLHSQLCGDDTAAPLEGTITVLGG